MMNISLCEKTRFKQPGREDGGLTRASHAFSFSGQARQSPRVRRQDASEALNYQTVHVLARPSWCNAHAHIRQKYTAAIQRTLNRLRQSQPLSQLRRNSQFKA